MDLLLCRRTTYRERTGWDHVPTTNPFSKTKEQQDIINYLPYFHNVRYFYKKLCMILGISRPKDHNSFLKEIHYYLKAKLTSKGDLQINYRYLY